MKDLLKQEFALTDIQIEQFATYYELLVEKNKVMNLTAITNEYEVYIKHFYDSLTISRVINLQGVDTVLDVGTGAGFPGIPLKILFPHLQLTLLDSLLKRVHFLQEVGEALHFKDVLYLHGRAEDIAQQQAYREQFDLVTSRAVAKLNVLAEYCLPFVRLGGTFVAMKGLEITEELAAAKQSLYLLGKASSVAISLSLPDQMGERHLLVVEKKQATPKKYPRNSGAIKKTPIS